MIYLALLVLSLIAPIIAYVAGPTGRRLTLDERDKRLQRTAFAGLLPLIFAVVGCFTLIYQTDEQPAQVNGDCQTTGNLAYAGVDMLKCVDERARSQ